MRGVSAVIAVILILMITVALAATSYVWFSEVFTTVTAGGTNVTARGVAGIATQFSIESARYGGVNNVTVAIRNTGSVAIDLTTSAAYISDQFAGVTTKVNTAGTAITSLATGSIALLNVTNTTAIGDVCGDPIRMSFGAGTPQTATIRCS